MRRFRPTEAVQFEALAGNVSKSRKNMPTYVYACNACGKEFEFEQRIVEDPITQCILCSVGKVKRVIQPVGIAFKGSGFYVNDSKTVTPSKDPSKEVSDVPSEAKAAETVSTESAPTTPAPAPAPTTSSESTST